MRKAIYSLLILLVLQPVLSPAQIKKVDVELYYIADAYDATDTTAGRILDAGSKTFRIFIELEDGYKLKKIYGDAWHALKIESTQPFYNNIDRPAACFGYLINKTWFQGNPTLALDSWLSLGLATKTNTAVWKDEDTDGSFIGGTNNLGGTAGIPGGLLVNNDPSAFVPFSVADGLAPATGVLSQWLDDGFRDLSGVDTTVFGSVNTGSRFFSNNAFLQQNSGVSGALPGNNKILVAQLTTLGDLTFELNVEVLDSAGNSLKFVARNDTLQADETVSPYLSYPMACGCTDPNFLEYNPAYGCLKGDSCKTRIVFGCLDTMACNFNPNANFNVQSLCCYPGYCNDRDLAVVCPDLANGREGIPGDFDLYPNPSGDLVSIKIPAGQANDIGYDLYDALGQPVLGRHIGTYSGMFSGELNLERLNAGVYVMVVRAGTNCFRKVLIKNQ